MDELQALLGDSYKEGMTVEEIGEFFKGKNFADLSTGNYVDKGKYDREINDFQNQVNNLNTELNDTKNTLNSKLSDEERDSQARAEDKAEIERLKQLLSENTVSGNKNTVTSIMTTARDTLGVKATDENFTAFVDNITTEDSKKSMAIANYVAQLVADSYEKGKLDATKDAMGDMGKSKGKQGSSEDNEIGAIGKRLAKANGNKHSENEYNYFK